MLDPVLREGEVSATRDGAVAEQQPGTGSATKTAPTPEGVPAQFSAPPASGWRHWGLAWGALIFLALIWGYTWPLMKSVLTYADPFVYAGMRTLMGGVLLIALLPALRRPVRPKAFWFTFLLGVLQTAGFVGLMTWALQGEGAGKTAILTYTMPFWLLLMAWVFLGERLKAFQWIAVLVALAGLILVLRPWEMSGGWSPFMAIGGAISWALSAIVAKLLRKRHQVDLLSLTAWQLFLGSLPLVVVGAALWSPPVWSGTFIYGLAFTVLFGNCLAWILWLYILHALPASTAGLGMLLTPVIGITASWIALGETPDGAEGAGMALIACALLLTVGAEILRGRRPRSRSRT